MPENSNAAFYTPVLFIVFNRPEHTKKVFERIREIRPKYLFVAADGPKNADQEDLRRCKEVRDLIMNGLDWNCEVKTLFRDENLGCGKGPAQAITWFFDHVEEGIILEDDCLPSVSFFGFCNVLLKRYMHEETIMAICGTNYLGKYRETDLDYFFSDGGNWGWASWRRAWKLFDYSMASWKTIPPDRKKNVFSFYPNFDLIYNKIIEEKFDAWDIQWHYARLVYNGLSITPTRNLVTNIGFDKTATHTEHFSQYLSSMVSFELNPLAERHPHHFSIDITYRKKFLKIFARTKRGSLFLRISDSIVKVRSRIFKN